MYAYTILGQVGEIGESGSPSVSMDLNMVEWLVGDGRRDSGMAHVQCVKKGVLMRHV